MKPHWLAPAVVTLACGSTSVTSPAPGDTLPGAGGASAADAGAGGAGLPPVNPSGKQCPAHLPDTQVCIEEGWFLLSRWTTAWRHDGAVPYDAEPRQPVYLDAFVLDQHEVTNLDYSSFLKSTGAPLLAPSCGRFAVLADGDGLAKVEEQSGWVAGVGPVRELDPVVCVTRDEARAYCASRSGRLPTVAEWFKAGRGAYPDARRFAWGEKPDRTSTDPAWWVGYAVLASVDPADLSGHSLGTQNVRVDGLGKSPRGALGLAGNASEHLSTCAEQLGSAYVAGAPLVRPTEVSAAACATGTLIGGSNWGSDVMEACAGQSLVVRGNDAHGHYPGLGGDNVTLDVERCTPNEFRDPETDGNGYRSWYVGFRCAYDVP